MGLCFFPTIVHICGKFSEKIPKKVKISFENRLTKKRQSVKMNKLSVRQSAFRTVSAVAEHLQIDNYIANESFTVLLLRSETGKTKYVRQRKILERLIRTEGTKRKSDFWSD